MVVSLFAGAIAKELLLLFEYLGVNLDLPLIFFSIVIQCFSFLVREDRCFILINAFFVINALKAVPETP